MAKTPASVRPVIQDPPGILFRRQIEAALAEGLAPDDLTLRLTLGDVQKLKRDASLPIEAISFAGGVIRFLGVRVEQGGVAASSLDRGEVPA